MYITEQDEDWFWGLIDTSRRGKNKFNHDKQVENLTKELTKLGDSQILKFDQIFHHLLDKSYSWNLWGAAYIIDGGCSDDTFDYFRSWLIGQGKTKFNNSIQNPEKLLDFMNPKTEYDWEGLEYCAVDAYEQLTGEEMPVSENHFTPAIDKQPKGREWKEKELPKLFPKLWEAFSKYQEYDEESEIRPKEIDPTTFSVTFNASEVPRPNFWTDLLETQGHKVVFRIIGSEPTQLNNVPFPDYSSHLMQLDKRINKDGMGILVKDISKQGQNEVHAVFELYDSKIGQVFQDLSICAAGLEDSKIFSGNCEFTGQKWLDFVKNGQLPD